METFAERLTKLRKRAGYRQEDFATELGVSIDTVRRWEGEKQEPRLGDLRNISRILGTPIDELVGKETEGSSLDATPEKTIKPHTPKSNKKGTIVIQQGNTRLEIPATSQGYAILREKLKEVSLNQEISLS